MKIGIIGLGLIGGSMAKDLRSQINVAVYGVDSNDSHCEKALQMGLVDEILTLDATINTCDVLILATPVHHIETFLPSLLDAIKEDGLIIDVGSTKAGICKAVNDHHRRGRYVPAHPLAGTEYSGPEAAVKALFAGKKNIVCEKPLIDEDALALALKIFESMGMITLFMMAEEHDRHLAYVSHLSHVSSFMLGHTVLDIEKDEKQIFNLAGTGFESTVRLAKSNPNTWAPIFQKNKNHISTALGSYITLLSAFKKALDNDDEQQLLAFMKEANAIQKILK